MYAQQRNLIIAAVAVVAVVVVVVVVVVTKKGAEDKLGIFTRCDGRKDPIDIKIDSCQNTEKDPCTIHKNADTTVTITFTPDQDSDKAFFKFEGSKITKNSKDACTVPGFKCPVKKGEKETLATSISKDNYKDAEDGQVKFEIFAKDDQDKDALYCVEFPAKLV